jgi:hypothetical protein
MKYLALALVAVAACEKAGPKEPLSPEEMALLRDIPGGNMALIGGSFTKMQSFVNTAMGKLAKQVTSALYLAPTSEVWADCLMAHANDRMIAGASITPQTELRIAYHGETIEGIETCATKAHFSNTVDPDRKFIAVTVGAPNGATLQIGYLQLPDGNLLSDLVLHNTQPVAFEPVTRAQLEAVAATLSTANATGDRHLIELAAKANRTKTFWFAGSGATTSLAKELGDVYGDVEITKDTVSFDVTAAFTDLRLAQRFETSYDRARSDTNTPEMLRTFTENLTLTRDGGTIHAAARLTLEQLQTFAAMIH